MRRPTYSEAVSTLALFIALGGTGYAATRLPSGSVGSAQLRRGAVTAAKLHAGAVRARAVAADSLTGRQIVEASLGTVPHARTAAVATTASDASLLGGATPASFRVRCPAGMVGGNGLCVEVAPRAAASWQDAMATCGSAARRLPSPGEMVEALDLLGAPQPDEWTSDTATTPSFAALEVSDNASRTIAVIYAVVGSVQDPYRCVSTPTN